MDKDTIEAELEDIQQQTIAQLSVLDDENEIESIRVSVLGKKGRLTAVLRGMGQLSAEERPLIGAVVNRVREAIETALSTAQAKVEKHAKEKKLMEHIDLSEPYALMPSRGMHPLTRTMEDILTILDELGFYRATGPEVEFDFYNFEALNFPPNHPARDMQDTFFVDDSVVLRTHTSPIQIREMLKKGKAPIAVSGFGRVYRHDQDNTHSPMFHQIEGLLVDTGIHWGHLKGTLQTFLQRLFDQSMKVRFRPSYFPFTEPSAEVDMSCIACHGTGRCADSSGNNENGDCKLCRGTGWIEILGCGMVDPEVFASVGFENTQGFAFGIGVERVAMLRYGIRDIRYFYENDHAVLSQFQKVVG